MSKSVRSVLGRRVISHSPDRHPQQADALTSQPDFLYTDGGPQADSGATDSLARATRRPSRIKRKPGAVN